MLSGPSFSRRAVAFRKGSGQILLEATKAIFVRFRALSCAACPGAKMARSFKEFLDFIKNESIAEGTTKKL